MNKSDHKIFSTGTKAVGAENDFYTLEKMDDPYYWEHFYARTIEPLMGELLPQIISQSNIMVRSGSAVIDEHQKAQLAILMVMQLFRGKVARELEHQLLKEIFPEAINEAKLLYGPLTDEQNNKVLRDFERDDYYLKYASMDVALDINRMLMYSHILCCHNFTLLRIQGDMEFATSDNPVMHINAVTKSARPFTNGLWNTSTIVVYPISPKLMLYTTHPDFLFGELSKGNGRIIDINSNRESNFISTMNRKQMEQCAYQMYARSQNTLKEIIQ